MIKKIKKKNCIICNSNKFINSFPYKTSFNKKVFFYKKCLNCKFVFIDPIPDKSDLKKMYENDRYHKNFYNLKNDNEYKKNYVFLKKFIKHGDHILDYGCGYGHFLRQIPNGIKKTGVEFNRDVVEFCKKKIKKTKFMTVNQFKTHNKKFEVIHLGDVLEHLIDPINFLNDIKKKLRKNGIIFISGPLERNISLVNYSFLVFGYFKNKIFKNFVGNFTPYHIFFCNYKNKKKMLSRFRDLKILKFEIYETGFPYSMGNIFKKIIAIVGIILSYLNFFGFGIGNRFRVILLKN
jgi:SAM-dependent methyltransferase